MDDWKGLLFDGKERENQGRVYMVTGQIKERPGRDNEAGQWFEAVLVTPDPPDESRWNDLPRAGFEVEKKSPH